MSSSVAGAEYVAVTCHEVVCKARGSEDEIKLGQDADVHGYGLGAFSYETAEASQNSLDLGAPRSAARATGFARSTTAKGSTNTVAPLEETSWTMPRTSPRKSALIGTT